MLNQNFTPSELEPKISAYWESINQGAPKNNGPAYCIMVPPPNVTGSLHLGHALQLTLMDTLVRFQRYQGKNVLLQVGTDHAGIATQMVVERQLAEQNITKDQLSREEFIDKIWEWKAQSGGRITQQMRQMGVSVDWDNERFTLDQGFSRAVQDSFIKLYQEGLIYRGKRLVNWDTQLLTAVSDLEVINENRSGQLWYIDYPIDESTTITVATTRPETMLGDQAICVHPDDERYQALIGKTASIPLTERRIPIIADTHVDPEFGTGCVKVTPAHDFNDYEIGMRHQLELVNILNPDGTLNEYCPKAYQGLDRIAARKQIIQDLKEQALLNKIEPHTLTVPIGDRSMTILEPMLTDQWFMNMKVMAEKALQAQTQGELGFIPSNWDKTYAQWLTDIQDWCISRQIVWGHRIPAYYDSDGNVFVGNSETEIRKTHQVKGELTQDQDVLDTWFSSALWPFATLGWPEKTSRLSEFYPNQLLITGFDIIFFWVARMVMLGMHLTDQVPFPQVYITGLIRDEKGQKMSKSKGNVLDPLDLINGITLDALVEKRTTGLMQPAMREKVKQATLKAFPNGIEAHGTDALRFTMLSLCTHGRDIKFDIQKLKSSQHFCNKIWNAARLLSSYQDTTLTKDHPSDALVIDALNHKINQLIQDLDQHLNSYRFDLYATALFDFFWHQYCDWFIECLKASQSQKLLDAMNQAFDAILILYHPSLPFITESIWQNRHGNDQSITEQDYPTISTWITNDTTHQAFTALQALIRGVRSIRSELNIAPKCTIDLFSVKDEQKTLSTHRDLIQKLAKIGNIMHEQAPEAACAYVDDHYHIVVPLEGLVDAPQEAARLRKKIAKKEKEIEKMQAKRSRPDYATKAPLTLQKQDEIAFSQLQSEHKTLMQYLHALEKICN